MEKVQNAGQEPVKKPEEVIAPPASVDNSMAELQAKYEALEVEKENYRKGMLKAKGKLPVDTVDLNDIDARIEQRIEERFASSRESQIIQEQQDIVKGLVKKNSELATALKNRAQSSNSSVGSSTEETATPKGEYFSKETIAEFKARGYDDAKIQRIKENFVKMKDMPVIASGS